MVEVCFVMSLFVVCLTTLLATPVIQSQMTDRLAMVQIMYPQIERHEGPVAREGKGAKRTKILRLFLFFFKSRVWPSSYNHQQDNCIAL